MSRSDIVQEKTSIGFILSPVSSFALAEQVGVGHRACVSPGDKPVITKEPNTLDGFYLKPDDSDWYFYPNNRYCALE